MTLFSRSPGLLLVCTTACEKMGCEAKDWVSRHLAVSLFWLSRPPCTVLLSLVSESLPSNSKWFFIFSLFWPQLSQLFQPDSNFHTKPTQIPSCFFPIVNILCAWMFWPVCAPGTCLCPWKPEEVWWPGISVMMVMSHHRVLGIDPWENSQCS